MATLRRCFVISPIGTPGSAIREDADAVLKYYIEPAMLKAGVETTRSDQLHEPGRITEQMFRSIAEADVCVAILTGHNPNVFYELALAQCARKPVIVMIAANETLPFDVADLRAVTYDLRPNSVAGRTYAAEVEKHLNAIANVHAVSPKPPMPLWSAELGTAFHAEPFTIGRGSEDVAYDRVAIGGVSLTEELSDSALSILEKTSIHLRLLLVDPGGLASCFAALRSKYRKPSFYRNRTQEILDQFSDPKWRHVEVRLARYPPSYGVTILQPAGDEKAGCLTLTLYQHHTADRFRFNILQTEEPHLFAEIRADFERMWDAARRADHPRIVILVGMPCAGKTTLGLLAKSYGYTFEPELSSQVLRGFPLSTDWETQELPLLKQQLAKDRLVLNTNRPTIIETWHVGNLANALLRNHGRKYDPYIPEVKKTLSRIDYCIYHIKTNFKLALTRNLENPLYANHSSDYSALFDNWDLAFKNGCDELGIPPERIIELDGGQAPEDMMHDFLTHDSVPPMQAR